MFILFLGLSGWNMTYAQPLDASKTVQKNADQQLQQAFEREFAYVQAEKRGLETQLKTLKTQNAQVVSTLENTIVSLEGKLATGKTDLIAKNEQFLQLEKRVASIQDEDASLRATLEQAAVSLDVPVSDASAVEQFAVLFTEMLTQIDTGRSVTEKEGIFFLPDGSEVNGSLLHIGQIATFGQSDAVTAPLIPVGNGRFQVVDTVETHPSHVALFTGTPSDVSLFMTEGFEKPIVLSKDRSIIETLTVGGLTAWVIALLGVFGLLLAGIRAVLLLRSPIRTLSDAVLEELKVGKTAGVSLLNQLWKSPVTEHDALMDTAESALLEEKGKLDRFSSAIVVIAAVAPLLGLLGTVTGMISTFEIITEHGTGDPKMLSGGISEALITTQLGLVVAIPMLLLGNMLKGWSEGVFGKLESTVLRLIAEKTQS